MPPVDIFARALAALEAGQGVAIATVTGAHGSTPRHLGARMAVTAGGDQWGTIGGGRIERVVVERAREVAAGAAAAVVRQHLVRDLAMCCGGSMEVVLTPAAPSRDVIATLGPRAHVLRVLGTPLDGGPLFVREVQTGDPRAHRPAIVDGALLEKLGPAERAIIFGLGHVARALGPLLASVGFAVIACDDNETGATESAPAWASDVVESFDAAEVERRVGGFGADDYVLIVTRDHAIDQKLLETLIGNDAIGYLGMIGSRGKVGRFEKRLRAKGLLDGEHGEARWARLRAPIGLDLGAETPDEIAIAIAAELVARRRRGSSMPGTWEYRRHHEENA
ncbi:MAG: XdhC family protein [Kofleriaceae bacterium]